MCCSIPGSDCCASEIRAHYVPLKCVEEPSSDLQVAFGGCSQSLYLKPKLTGLDLRGFDGGFDGCLKFLELRFEHGRSPAKIVMFHKEGFGNIRLIVWICIGELRQGGMLTFAAVRRGTMEVKV